MSKISLNHVVIIVLLLFVAFITVDSYNSNKTTPVKAPKTDTSALGNRMSEYFYVINTEPNEKINKEHQAHAAEIIDPSLKAFYQGLDWRPRRNVSYYRSNPDSAWGQIDSAGNKKANFLNYWQTIRPSMQKIYEQTISYKKVEYPVLQFRCSDSPFNKHIYYHMPKASSVKWMAEKIKERGYSKAIILSCNKHRSLDQNSCATYIDYYTQILAESGVEVTNQCSSIYEDFATMVHSPILVSMSGSSYAFMAGVSKDPQNYISCNMGLEKDGTYILQTDADWILDSRAPLLHKDVADYNNAADVIKKLSL